MPLVHNHGTSRPGPHSRPACTEVHLLVQSDALLGCERNMGGWETSVTRCSTTTGADLLSLTRTGSNLIPAFGYPSRPAR